MHVPSATLSQPRETRVFTLRQLFVLLASAGIVCAWIRAWGSGSDLLLVAAGALWHAAVRGLCWTDLRRGSRADVAWESFCHVACLGLAANMVVYAVLAWISG